MKYVSLKFSGILFFIVLLFGSLNVASAEPIDSIAAVVNDGVITNQQLATKVAIAKQQMLATNAPAMSPEALRKKVLQDLIYVKLQMQVAKKMNINVSKADIDNAIQQIATRNNMTMDQLKAELLHQGMTYNQYQQEIQEEMTLNAVQEKTIAPRVRVTDQQVTDFLNIHNYKIPVMANAAAANSVNYHIQVLFVPLNDASTPQQISDAMEGAKQAYQALQAGANFQQFPISKLGVQYDMQEVDLGWRNLAQIPDLFAPYLKNLSPGGYAGPVKAPNGVHIIRLVAINGQQPSAQQNDIEQYHVRHILLKTTPLLNDVQTRVRLDQMRDSIVRGSANFATVATQNSQDPGSAGNGGDLGWVTGDGLDPTFAKVMMQTNVGAVSEPFKSQFGWHILQVLGKKEITDKQQLLRTQAKMYLFQQKYNETLQNWLRALQNASYVKIY